MGKKKKKTLADKQDIHQLYEHSVQYPKADIDFITKTFIALKKRKPVSLREDFCGTASLCCQWIKENKKNLAVGVDLDRKTLNWSIKHNLSQLTNQQRKRITLINRNVLDVSKEPVDVISAFNFSYWLLKERKELKRYFKQVYKTLNVQGILYLDAYGGYDSFREIQEEREVETDEITFTYQWNQEFFNPITNNLICTIDFYFNDGSAIKSAFRYDWRLWTLPELRDLLNEVGFRKITAYWQGFDKEGEADGIFKPAQTADADAGWVCYLIAEKAH